MPPQKRHIIATVTTDLCYDQRMQRICTTLQSAGYQVTLLGRLLPNSKSIDFPFQTHRLKCHFQKGKFFYIEYNIRLFFWLLTQRFDILNAVDLDSIMPCMLVAKLRGKPCVYDAHEYFTEVPEVVNRPFIKGIWEWVANVCIPRMSACYTVGDGLAKEFSKRYRMDFKVVRNLPFKNNKNAEIIENKAAELTNKIIFYQGALNEGRGLEEVIMAMRHVQDATLHIAGEGDLSERLHTLVQIHQLGDKVYFLGYILPKDLKKHTQSAYICLNLLENKGLSYYYSLANKCFDSMQAGVPLIQMNFPEYAAIQERFEVAILLDDLAENAIVSAIQRLLEDEKLYSKLAQNCKNAAAYYNWEQEESVLLSVYKDLG